MTARVLIVDDEAKIRSILTRILKDEGYQVRDASSGEEAIQLARDFHPDVILMDLRMPGMNGIDSMVEIRRFLPCCMTIILTAYGTIPSAVEAVKRGAYDYLTKPFDNDELLLVIRRAVEHLRLSREVESLREQLREKYSFENIIGVSAAMQEVFELMHRVLPTDVTVLIQGESGTGKELVARALHYHGPRQNKPWVVVNCGAIPANLIESEFFGHERGAFTDAREQRIGKFEQANGGTLFFDEIGELSPDAQVKLLRVLQEKEITRVGGRETIPVDVRIIAATNKNLEEEVKKGSFREDLFYRISVFTISIPPLRERREDIPPLVEHFLQKYSQKLGVGPMRISREAMELLEDYPWPGNVRELENVIQRAMILCKKGTIIKEDLPLRIQGYAEEETLGERVGLEERIKRLTEQLEREIILRTLEKCGGNRTQTARELQISRKTLFNKMRRYGIGSP